MPYFIRVNPTENNITLHPQRGSDADPSHVFCEVYPQDEVGAITDDAEAMRLATLFANAEETAKELATLKEAVRTIRDAVLNERGPLAEMGLEGEQINAVLAVIDDETAGVDLNS